MSWETILRRKKPKFNLLSAIFTYHFNAMDLNILLNRVLRWRKGEKESEI
jgi:hypothetical protein